jgi:hypothetical protein
MKQVGTLAIKTFIFGATAFLWLATVVTAGAIARVLYELVHIGFILFGIWPSK